MKYTSLDSIVCNVLLQKGYPMHFYLQFMVFAVNGYRQLYFDAMNTPSTTLIQLDANGAGKLPCDYVDYCKVGIRVGQFVRPMVFKDSYNRLPNINTKGEIVPYGNTDNYAANYTGNVFWNTNYIDNYGNSLGKQYGVSPSTNEQTFKIIAERGIIQCNELMANQIVVMEYITDGSNPNAAYAIDPYAIDVIDAYIKWQLKENRRDYSEGEKMRVQQEYSRQRKIYKARRNDVGTDELKQIMYESMRSTPK